MPKLSQEWSQINDRLTEIAHTAETTEPIEPIEIDSQPGEPLESSVLAEDFPLLAAAIEQ